LTSRPERTNYLLSTATLDARSPALIQLEHSDGIIIPVVEHCMGAEILEARGALTCMKEHQSVDIRNVLVYKAYVET